MTSVRAVCETIAKAEILTKEDGTHPTAKEIFEYSPQGELFMLWPWYEEALRTLGRRWR